MRVLTMLAGLTASLYGCAGMRMQTGGQWQCDARADEAVNNGLWEAALEGHAALLMKEPENCLAIYHLGYIQGRLGDREAEVSQYRRAIACGYADHDQLYFNLGMALADLHDLDGARDAFARAVRLNPENAENHFGQALAFQGAGRTVRAEKALLQAIDLDAGHWEARLLLARLCLDQSRWAEARGQLEIVLQADPDHPEALDLWETMVTRQQELYQ